LLVLQLNCVWLLLMKEILFKLLYHAWFLKPALFFHLLILLSTIPLGVMAQETFQINGKITNQKNEPISGVFIQAANSGKFTISKTDGNFSLALQKSGLTEISFTLIGFKRLNKGILINKDTSLLIVMKEESLSLSEVRVVSKEQKIGSVSSIGETAIKHTQPTSLADALQLLPGQLAINPNLSNPQQILIRQVPSTTDGNRANALGTSLVLDGVPLSNNANLQSNVGILNSGPGVLPPFSSVAGRGNDLRQISADNIEEIEVIRGVPSAKYGDLTTGAILVKTRAGVYKPRLITRFNPNLIQQAFGMGFRLPANYGTATIDADYSLSQDDPRNTFGRYARTNAQISWSKNWLKSKNLFTTTRFAFFNTNDETKLDPVDLRNQRQNQSVENGFRLISNGKYNIKNKLISSLSYDIGFTSQKQKSYFQELVTRDLFPVTSAIKDTTLVARYGESEYLSSVAVNGSVTNIYGRLEFNALNFSVNENNLKFNHRVLAGTEYRNDGNNGLGRQFDPTRPPRQNYSVGDRPRSYEEIPSLVQLAYYAESLFKGSVFSKNIALQTGLRYDILQPENLLQGKSGNVLAPRLNLAIETIKNLNIKLGYGITSKAPTLNFLYPGNRFIDLVNFNYFAVNPAERLVIMTTRVFNTDNPNLRASVANKMEIGLDYEKAGLNGFVTAFRENTTGAFGFNRNIVVVPVVKLKAESFPAGAPPLISPTPQRIDPFYAAFDVPVNNRTIENTGVEFQVNTPKIKGLNTSFNVSGAYIRSYSFDDGIAIDANRAVFSNITPNRIAIYNSAFASVGKRFNTSLRFISHIPGFKFVFSGLVQTVWLNNIRSASLSNFPIGFIDLAGNLVNIPEAQREDATFTDLRRVVSITLNNPDNQPPLWLFNIRMTKEFKKNLDFSFYINNFISDQGTYFNTISQTNVRRNQPLFFGAEFSLSF